MISSRPDISYETWRLIDAVATGLASDSELQSLEMLLLGNPKLQQTYLDYSRMHAGLAMHAQAQRAVDSVGALIRAGLVASAANSTRATGAAAEFPVIERPAGGRPTDGRWGLGLRRWSAASDMLVGGLVISAVAAAFWGLATLGVLILRNAGRGEAPAGDRPIAAHTTATDAARATAGGAAPAVPRQASQPPPPADGCVATLTSFHGQWAKQGPIYRPGDRVRAGTLPIESGVAQLLLDSGVEATLTGKTEVSLFNPRSMYVARGRLLAKVPPQAIGFQVGTPAARLIDLGTEFGVEVSAQGQSQVHVFQGTVEFSTLAGNAPPHLLRSSQAVDASTAGHVQPIAAQPSRFLLPGAPRSARGAPVRVVRYWYRGKVWTEEQDRQDAQHVKLTDGEHGSFSFGDGLWAGFEHPPYQRKDAGEAQVAISFVLDERAARDVRLLRITYLTNHPAAVHAPDRMRIRSAAQQTELPTAHWQTLVGFDDETSVPIPDAVEKGVLVNGVVKNVTFDLPALAGPNVELEFDNDGHWTFLSEVQFLAVPE